MDGGGNPDLLIGAPGESSVYLAFLNRTGDAHNFSSTGNLLHQQDYFVISVSALGGIDNDNQMEVLIASKTQIYIVHFSEDGMAILTSRLNLLPVIRRIWNIEVSLSFIGLDDEEDVCLCCWKSACKRWWRRSRGDLSYFRAPRWGA